MNREQCLDNLELIIEVLDKITRGFDEITEDGKCRDFTPTQKRDMAEKAIEAVCQMEFYLTPNKEI